MSLETVNLDPATNIVDLQFWGIVSQLILRLSNRLFPNFQLFISKVFEVVLCYL